jgi:hypothetical protein
MIERRKRVSFDSIVDLLRSERGVALPVAVGVLMISGLLAAVAATSAFTANSQSYRDRNVKRAIAAADAGINVGTYRLNALASVLTTTLPCVSLNVETGVLNIEAVLADTWCREQTEELDDGASFRYRVSNAVRVSVDGQDVWQRKIVATGIVHGVRRRVVSTLNAPTGTALYGDVLFSQEDFTMRNYTRIDGNVRSNGNVITQNNSLICGNVTVGPGKEFRGGNQCSGFTSQAASEPFVLSPVIFPLTNDDARIGTLDPWTGPQSIQWNLATRVLELQNSATLTLTGGNYVFCSLELRNSAQLIIPADGTPVRIYIDSPENCGGTTLSLGLYNSSQIVNPSGDPTMVQLYVAGSTAVDSFVQFHNLHELVGATYAPNSTITFDNNNRLTGAVTGKKVTMVNNLELRWDARLATLYLGDVPLPIYHRQSWVECVPAPSGSEPDSGC